MKNYALDALIMERDLLTERADTKRSSLKYFQREVSADVTEWEAAIVQIDAAIAHLRKNKIVPKPIARAPDKGGNGDRPAGPAPGPADGAQLRKGCKHVANCGKMSLFKCKTECVKHEDRSCTLIRYRNKKGVKE